MYTEKDLNTKCVVEMVKNQTILHPASVNLGKGDSRYSFHAVYSVICKNIHYYYRDTPSFKSYKLT